MAFITINGSSSAQVPSGTSTVRVHGEGFSGFTPVKVHIFNTFVDQTLTTGIFGDFDMDLNISSLADGSYTVNATQTTGRHAEATLGVGTAPGEATITISPQQINQGLEITCSLSGFSGSFAPLVIDGNVIAPEDIAENGAYRTTTVWVWRIATDAPIGNHIMYAYDTSGVEIARATFTVLETTPSIFGPVMITDINAPSQTREDLSWSVVVQTHNEGTKGGTANVVLENLTTGESMGSRSVSYTQDGIRTSTFSFSGNDPRISLGTNQFRVSTPDDSDSFSISFTEGPEPPSEDIDFEISDMQVPFSVKEDDPINVIVSVINTGNATVSNITVRIRRDNQTGQILDSKTINSLSANQIGSASFIIPAGTFAPGSHTLVSEVVHGVTVYDSLSKSFAVTEGEEPPPEENEANLKISTLNAPSQVNAGETFNVTATVTNQSEQAGSGRISINGATQAIPTILGAEGTTVSVTMEGIESSQGFTAVIETELRDGTFVETDRKGFAVQVPGTPPAFPPLEGDTTLLILLGLGALGAGLAAGFFTGRRKR